MELLIVVGLIVVVLIVAVPGLLRARMSSNETSTVASLRDINRGDVMYSGTGGSNNFAVTFTAIPVQ